MKVLFTLLFTVASSISLLSQQFDTLTIVDKNTITPVPYAIVSNLEKTKGGYANEGGVFNLTKSEIAHEDSLVISAIGYEDRTVNTKVISIQDTLYLTPTDLTLSEVVVVASNVNDRNKKRYLGVNRRKHSGMCFHSNKSFGREYAVRMEKLDINDKIDQVYIYLVKDGAGDAPFRVKIYNDEGGSPAKLLHAVIVNPEKKLKNWTAISLSKEDITQNEKIFYVAFEWLPLSNENYYKNKWSDVNSYGQILGLSTKSPDIVYYMKGSPDGAWWEGREIQKKLPAHFQYTVPMIKVKMK